MLLLFKQCRLPITLIFSLIGMRVQYYITFQIDIRILGSRDCVKRVCFKGSLFYLLFPVLLAQKMCVWSLFLTMDANLLNYKGNSSFLGTERAACQIISSCFLESANSVCAVNFFHVYNWLFFFFTRTAPGLGCMCWCVNTSMHENFQP